MDKFYPLKVLALLGCIIACCAAGGYLLHIGFTWRAVGCFALAGAPLFILFRSISNVHKKIDYFIDAISNDDYTFRFPSAKKLWSSSADLSRQLNRVKEMMQQKRLAIQEQEKYYEVLLAKINSGILLVNKTDHVLQANQAALKLISREIFTHLSQLESFAPELYGVLHSIRSGEQQKVVLFNEKERIELLVQASFFALRGTTYKLFVIQDVKQLLDEQEMEIWTKLFRILSHEIMNSITPITSLSDSLLRLQNDPEAASTLKEDTIHGLQVINETGKGLLSFVESYHRLLRMPTPRKEPLDPSDFFNGTILLCSHLPYFSQIEIHLDIDPNAPPLHADANLLGQVMINLVKNAIQAIEQTGIHHGEIRLSYQKTPEGNGLIEVSDNGQGIAPDLVGQVFIPFFTTKSDGSGIGLSMARQIMRAHGGRIQVQSTPGQLTKFSLYF